MVFKFKFDKKGPSARKPIFEQVIATAFVLDLELLADGLYGILTGRAEAAQYSFLISVKRAACLHPEFVETETFFPKGAKNF